MIAVTIATPDYADLAHEQAGHFQAHSGLEVVILRVSKADGYAKKLELHRLFKGRTVVFFDSDYRLIRKVNLGEFNGRDEFFAAIDPGIFDKTQWPYLDSAALDMDRNAYFNSGFWIANFNRASHVAAFDCARQLYAEKRNGLWSAVEDIGEQSFLNYGIQRQQVALEQLHPRWNFFIHSWRLGNIPEIPTNINGLHAAGEPLVKKKMMLDAQELLFGPPQNSIISPGAREWYEGIR